MTGSKVLILVEGQTEETVVREVIAPHLETLGCYQTQAVILETKRAASGLKYRGGVRTWAKVDGDLRRLLRDGGDHAARLFTALQQTHPEWVIARPGTHISEWRTLRLQCELRLEIRASSLTWFCTNSKPGCSQVAVRWLESASKARLASNLIGSFLSAVDPSWLTKGQIPRPPSASVRCGRSTRRSTMARW